MIHHQNLEYILRHGFQCANSPLANPDYLPIGDSGLIQDRNIYPVPIIPPNGNLGNYIPFYFGYRSPMLLRIKTGNKGIRQYPQENIIYLCANIENIIKSGAVWCFTDGQAKNKTTQFFNKTEDLNKVDWNAVYTPDWHNTEEDYDKMRRKQAEFLVQDSLPVSVIDYIVVYNQPSLQKIEKLVNFLVPSIQMKINRVETNNKNFYY